MTESPAFPRVHIATDHAGMELSAHLIRHLSEKGYDVTDHGPNEYDALDDYPSFCMTAALAVGADQEAGTPALGIVLGGSGNGEQIAANKVRGVRAVLAWNHSTPRWPGNTTRPMSLPSADANTTWKKQLH